MMSLECRVPPLLLFGLIVAAMLVWGGAAESGSGAGWRLAALLLAVLGTVFGLGGVLRFRRQGTTVTPLHPEQASALVTGGLYRLSRNPMYLGLLCWTMALACYLGGLWVWLGPLLLWGWLSRWQIVPEERALQARFGDAYADYCRWVRRWC
ncbi:methyltransferase family protein [Aeromonas hydrophila]|uniref:methyltransferase family protein n=1 Tax=Aeromonas hydrophila TaxID=644 RepID=UPI002B47984E|nr:isoprenylcysteine carboxylmethyltransferase family protein [Aeromonas hydrophila]